MIIIKTQKRLTAYLKKLNIKNIKIGFVPTMGALHCGHLSLIKSAKIENDHVISSIFINPTQFNNHSDFKHYPVTIEKDIEKLVSVGCDVLFLPDEKEIYHPEYLTKKYNLGNLENILEGYYRPGHFQGVCQIVDILLDIVNPHNLYLGQKDYQQCMVIKSLIEQQNFKNISIRIMPTIREKDGLAMSSRNLRLSKQQREKAVHIYKALLYISDNYRKIPVNDLEQNAKNQLEKNGFAIDYVAIADAETLNGTINNKAIALIAASIDEIRLIDNMILD
jgi:pantoate--beta-alanine ligase